MYGVIITAMICATLVAMSYLGKKQDQALIGEQEKLLDEYHATLQKAVDELERRRGV